jgi:hypothetical protein
MDYHCDNFLFVTLVLRNMHYEIIIPDPDLFFYLYCKFAGSDPAGYEWG